MKANLNDPYSTPLDFFLDVPFSNYLNLKRIDGAFGEEITVIGAYELFNIKFVIISTLGRAAEATITPQNFIPKGRVCLGNFAGNHGEQYIVLNTAEDCDIANDFF